MLFLPTLSTLAARAITCRRHLGILFPYSLNLDQSSSILYVSHKVKLFSPQGFLVCSYNYFCHQHRLIIICPHVASVSRAALTPLTFRVTVIFSRPVQISVIDPSSITVTIGAHSINLTGAIYSMDTSQRYLYISYSANIASYINSWLSLAWSRISLFTSHGSITSTPAVEDLTGIRELSLYCESCLYLATFCG
jgi:hypothetical protein